MLSYRAVSAWEDMVKLIHRFSRPLAETVMVREQLGLALNRLKRHDEAQQVLLKLIEERGPSSETCGILGRVYKDQWEDASKSGNALLAAGYLDKAIKMYLQGFQADWRDAYPGINAVTLMELRNPPAERRKELVIAGLTILRAHHVADRPKSNLAPLGSFDEWSAWVRAALVWLDEPDPCLTMAAARDTDPDLKRLRNLLGAWSELFPGAAIIKRAIQEAREHTKDRQLRESRAALMEAFGEIAGERGGEINARALGKWITRHKGRIVDALCFEEDGISHHATLWKVTRPSQKES